MYVLIMVVGLIYRRRVILKMFLQLIETQFTEDKLVAKEEGITHE